MLSRHSFEAPRFPHFLLLIIVGLAFQSSPAYALKCSAANHTGVSNLALAATFPTTAHTGCTVGVPMGAAVSCVRLTMEVTYSYENKFLAGWNSTNARLLDATGGCSFMCTSGDCFVGNDGLPVELLRFGVE